MATTRAAAAQAGISEKKAEWCEVSDLDISVQGKEMMQRKTKEALAALRQSNLFL